MISSIDLKPLSDKLMGYLICKVCLLQMVLMPNVRYELNNNDTLTLADLKLVYIKSPVSYCDHLLLTLIIRGVPLKCL